MVKGEMTYEEAADRVFLSPEDAASKAPAGYAEGSQPVVVKNAGENPEQPGVKAQKGRQKHHDNG